MCEKVPEQTERESCLCEFKCFIWKQFSRSLSSPSGQSSCSASHSQLICLRTFPLGCTHNTLAKMDIEVKASGRSKTHQGLKLSSDFWLQRAFLHTHVKSPYPEKGESRDPLIFYSDRVLPLCPAMIIFLRCLQETKPGCWPCFCNLLHELLNLHIYPLDPYAAWISS